METRNEYAVRVAQLAVNLSRAGAFYGDPALFAIDLIKLARQHNGICAHECNVALDERAAQRRERRKERIEKRITEILAGLDVGITVHFDGDPRGYTVKLHFPPSPGKGDAAARTPCNTWGGAESGWGI